MKIDEDTLYAEYASYVPYISKQDQQRVAQAAQQKYGNYYALDFDTFFGILGGDYSVIGDRTKGTAFQVLWMQGFAQFVETLSKTLEKLTIKPTTRQARAQEGTYAFDFKSNVLLFLRSYFGLHSFKEAGRLTIGEYLTARQDTYNSQLIQRNYERIQREELNLRNK